MIRSSDSRDVAVATAARVLISIESAAYLLAATLHLGVRIPLGSAVLAEPVIFPATIVEGLSGLFLGVAVYGLFTRKSWAWTAAVAAHIFSIGGVLLGMFAMAVGAGPSTELNEIYHRVILLMLASSLTLLITPAGRAALRHGDRV